MERRKREGTWTEGRRWIRGRGGGRCKGGRGRGGGRLKGGRGKGDGEEEVDRDERRR